jgi:hypothetical protein
MWHNANANIMFDSNCPGAKSTTTGNVYGNTVDCSNGTYCFRYFYRANGTASAINLKNNHWITTGNTININNPGAGGANTSAFNQSNNLPMSPSTAASQGYTPTNNYAPTSATSGTVSKGGDLSASCFALTNLCKDIRGNPRVFPWDAGAYEFGGSVPTSPVQPPTGFSAVVQ